MVQLSDPNHTIPVYNPRTGETALAVGTGKTNTVELTGIEHEIVHIGDLYLSSADGEVFPRDFPVATVKEKRYDNQGSTDPIVLATTATDYNRARELLLIWQIKNGQVTTVKQ